MDTTTMTRKQLVAAIDGHVSTFLGFRTGLGGLTNKSKAALCWLVQRTEVMAEHAAKAAAVRAKYDDRDFWTRSTIEDMATWTAERELAEAIWGNLWEGYDGRQ